MKRSHAFRYALSVNGALFGGAVSGSAPTGIVLSRIEKLQRDLPYVVSSNRAETVLACWYKDVDALDRSGPALLAAIGGARDRGEDSMLPSPYGHLALTEIWSGDPAAAREALDLGLPLVPEGTTTPVALLIAEAQLTLLTGGIAATRPRIDRLPEGGAMIANVKVLAALIAGDDEAAADVLGPVHARARESGVREPGRRGRFEGNLGQALVNLGRTEEARTIAAELLELGASPTRPTLVGVARRVEGLAEAAIGDLDAAGRTNREVAARLFISVRTVETHLASIYRKSGVRSRSELAASRPC